MDPFLGRWQNRPQHHVKHEILLGPHRPSRSSIQEEAKKKAMCSNEKCSMKLASDENTNVLV